MMIRSASAGAMGYGDYIVYADESGTHNLSVIDADYPVFVLTFCIFRKSDYVDCIVPVLQKLKIRG